MAQAAPPLPCDYTGPRPARVYTLNETAVFEPDADGPAFASMDDAVALIGEARSQGATVVAIPALRLSPDFFRLRTGIAGAFLQKFVLYGVRVVILGPIDAWVDASVALRDFVRESNRGTAIWFCRDEKELAARLGT